jgi:hypothetical protein
VLDLLSCQVEIGYKGRISNPAFTEAKTERDESNLADTTNEESKLADTTSEEYMHADTKSKESKQLIRLFRDPDGELRWFNYQKHRSEGISVFRTKGE